MKSFRFRLETILRYRRQMEREKGVALTGTRRLVADQERKRLETHAVLGGARDQLRKQQRGGEIHAAEARQQRRHVGWLRRGLSEVMDRLRNLELELDRRRDETLRARREREVLEMLKVHRRAEYFKEAERIDRGELDDIAAKKEVIKRTATQE